MARLLPLLILLAFAIPAAAEPNPGPFKKIAILHLREKNREAIDESVRDSILRRIEEARAWGADCVVLDIESYGGEVGSSVETGDEIYDLGREIHTIAYVQRKAISGAAMLSIACREIVMNEVANIGDSQVIMAAGTEVKIAPEKFQTTVAAKFRTYAKGNGYPVEVAEAMVRAEMEVHRYRKPLDPEDPSKGYEWVYVRTDSGGSPPSEWDIQEWGWIDKTLVVPKGQLATFTADEAIEFSVCSRIEPTLESLIESISAPDAEVVTLGWTWAEKASRWLLGWRFLLFLVGAGALYFALKMPGTGVPEALAVIAFGLFFGASALAGFAGPIELILFVVGLALIVLEIFVFPGIGVAGIAGLFMVLGSIALAAIPENIGELSGPEGEYGPYLIQIAGEFMLGVFLAILAVFILARNLPKVPFFRRLSLEPPAALAGTGSASAVTTEASLVGDRGVAESRLRPSGRARIGRKVYDVVTEGGFVEPGQEVRVVAVRGNAIIVRPLEKKA
jgi:membrane-bound serine protease (ClpP class)